jgi:hypothetical protein
MMTAYVKFVIPDILHIHSAGRATLNISGESVGDCLKKACLKNPGLKPEIFDDNEELLIRWTLLLNKQLIHRNPLQHPTVEGDVIELLPLVVGG